MLKKILLLSTSLFCFFNAQAQDTWTLERCIDYAQKNSISVKQAQISIGNAELSERQFKANKRPSLSASGSAGANFGRAINPSTNSFISTQLGFNSYGLNISGPIYQGGQIDKSIAQNKYNQQAAQADMEQAAMNISLSVASSYLRILLNEEQVTAAKKRFDQAKQQLVQINKLIAAGARPENDKYDFIAQLSRSEQSLVSAQNSVDIEYLTLKQLLELDPDVAFKIDRPEVQIPTENGVEGLTMRAVYQQAYGRQPQIKAGEMRLKSAEMQADIERTSYRPSLSWFGGVSTNYSTFAPANYFKTLRTNLGQNLGLSLNVPIYDKGLTRIAIERAKLNVSNQLLLNQRTNQQLKADIQNALATAKAAKKQLEASEKTYNATKIASENTDRKLTAGASSTFEVTTAKNNMETAERDFIIAKYDYIFRLKIVDFYQGRKITLGNEK
jgi:outer membrane protein